MPSFDELMLAKRALSAQYLRPSLLMASAGFAATNIVREAIAFADRNVHAVGLGRKFVEGKAVGDLCVRLYVRQKLAESLLAPIDLLPKAIDGIPTDVVEAPPARIAGKKQAKRVTPRARGRSASAAPAAPAAPVVSAAAGAVPVAVLCTQNRQARQRPFVAGISIGHVNISAGTLGYFCRSTRAGDDANTIYLLSNNHVFADLNRGVAGDEIDQPGRVDGGTSTDRVATLARFHPLKLNGAANPIDAAIASVDAGVDCTTSICSIGTISGVADAKEDQFVRKHGRTTGYTEGQIDDLSFDVTIQMDHNDPTKWALFTNQIRIARTPGYPAFALPGDSGSLVVDRDSQSAIGLFFACPSDGSYGIANRLSDVLQSLEVQLL